MCQIRHQINCRGPPSLFRKNRQPAIKLSTAPKPSPKCGPHSSRTPDRTILKDNTSTNLVPGATCDPVRDRPRSHEVTQEGTEGFCHLIGWRENKRFSLIIMIMQSRYEVNWKERSTAWRITKVDVLRSKNISRGHWMPNVYCVVINKLLIDVSWTAVQCHLEKRTVNVNRNMNMQPGQIPSWSASHAHNAHKAIPEPWQKQWWQHLHLRWYWAGPVNVLSWGPVHTMLTMIWGQNKIITDRPPVHTVTASKSFENGAKLKRNAFQFETKTSLSIKYLGPIKVKCQSEDSFIDFVHNFNFQNDPLMVVSIAISRVKLCTQATTCSKDHFREKAMNVWWPTIDISEVTKSHPKGDDDIKFSIDWFHKWTEAIKMKLSNSMPSQVNVRIVEIE